MQENLQNIEKPEGKVLNDAGLLWKRAEELMEKIKKVREASKKFDIQSEQKQNESKNNFDVEFAKDINTILECYCRVEEDARKELISLLKKAEKIDSNLVIEVKTFLAIISDKIN